MTDFNYTKNMYNKYADIYIAKRKVRSKSFYNLYLSDYQLLKQLKPIIKNKMTLDIGCGDGTFTNELFKLGAKIQGVDISEKLIEYAKQHYKKINFNVVNASKLNFNNRSFDIVVSNLMIHYFKELKPLFNEISRVLKPGGIFLFSFHHPFNEVLELHTNGKKTKVFIMPYFHEDEYFWEMEGMKMKSYHHTFTEVSKKLKESSFYIEEIEESQAPRSSIKLDKEMYNFSNKYPTFCIIKAVKK